MRKLFAITALSFFVFFNNLSAQRGWEVGGWIGMSNYFGDLNTKFDLTNPGGGIGAIARYDFNSRISARTGLNYGYIHADDANSKNIFERQRNLSFSSHIFEAQAGIEFNFLPFIHGSHENYFTPYVHAGLTVFNFNPRAKYEGEWYNLQELGTEGQFRNEEYARTQVGMYYGVGLKWEIIEDISFNFEISARNLFTDFLDDVSGVYPDMDDLETLHGATAVALSDRSLPNSEGVKYGEPGRQRGDLKNSDIYSFTSVGIVFYFGKVQCPSFYN